MSMTDERIYEIYAEHRCSAPLSVARAIEAEATKPLDTLDHMAKGIRNTKLPQDGWYSYSTEMKVVGGKVVALHQQCLDFGRKPTAFIPEVIKSQEPAWYHKEFAPDDHVFYGPTETQPDGCDSLYTTPQPCPSCQLTTAPSLRPRIPLSNC